jgi:hypothetical protein
MPSKKPNRQNLFKNEADKQDHKMKMTSEKFEAYTFSLREEIGNFKGRIKELALCIDDLEGLPSHMLEQIRHQIKEEGKTLSSTLDQKMEKSFTTSENKIQSLIQTSEKLIQKNKKAAYKKHWYMMVAFGVGCFLVSLGIPYLIIQQNLTRIDSELIHFSYIGENLEIAKSQMNEQEKEKLKAMLSEAWDKN